ncbi:MAG: hypothetical protein WCB46_09790, partial [Methanoregula sp.]
FRFMYTCLTFHNRIPIFSFQSDRDFYFQIGIRFLFSNRDHDRDRKPFRKNQGSIFILKSDPGFFVSADPPVSFYSAEISVSTARVVEKGIEFHFQEMMYRENCTKQV